MTDDQGAPRLGRPRGEVRAALSDASGRLLQERGCFTGRDAAHLAKVAFEDARLTLKRMVEAGELMVIGHARAPGVSRPLNLYSAPQAQIGGGAAALDAAVRSWADFR